MRVSSEEAVAKEHALAMMRLGEGASWEALCVELETAVEIELETIAKAEDPITVTRAAGVIQGLRRVMTLPDMYKRAHEIDSQ